TPSAPTEAPVATLPGIDEIQEKIQEESQPEEVAEEIGEQQPEGPLAVARDFDIESYESEASAAIMVHSASGQVLFNNNAHEVRSIASLSKLMAALVAIEGLDKGAEFTVSEHAASTSGKSAGLTAGEVMLVEDALFAVLLESGNDAVVALEDYYNALHPSPEGSAFVARMNALAKERGLPNTSFVEPTGLSASNASTAFEVAKLMEYAYSNATLRTILGVPRYATTVHSWETTNTLLHKEPGIVGAKTGYTEEAGQSLALVGVTDSGETVVMVVLDADGDRIAEGAQMWRWVQKAYEW
ncbi:MAG: serine hydrolase, partial [Candidatus Spechtbacterales bacterium]